MSTNHRAHRPGKPTNTTLTIDAMIPGRTTSTDALTIPNDRRRHCFRLREAGGWAATT